MGVSGQQLTRGDSQGAASDHARHAGEGSMHCDVRGQLSTPATETWALPAAWGTAVGDLGEGGRTLGLKPSHSVTSRAAETIHHGWTGTDFFFPAQITFLHFFQRKSSKTT